MGTNYYLHEKPPCQTCGHADEPLHIGKSSAGWCFSLHVDPESGIKDLPDWESRWSMAGAVITTEYDEIVSVDEMRAIILARTWTGGTEWDEDYLAQNDAARGPLGLLRARIGSHCLGHGSGAYDLIPGEFC